MEKDLIGEQYIIVGMGVSVEKSWHTVIGEVGIETGKTNKISRESISRLSANRRDHLWNSSALDLDFSPQVSSHFLLYPPPTQVATQCLLSGKTTPSVGISFSFWFLSVF